MTLTTCQVCYAEGITVTATGRLAGHCRSAGCDRSDRVHCAGSGAPALTNRAPVRGATRRKEPVR